MKKITVWDAVCGEGKSTYARKQIKESGRPSVIVVPLLSEVKTYRDDIKGSIAIGDLSVLDKHVVGKKIDAFEDAIKAGRTVITTASLFSWWTKKHSDIIKERHYKLYLDEEVTLVQKVTLPVKGTKKDKEAGRISWETIRDAGSLNLLVTPTVKGIETMRHILVTPEGLISKNTVYRPLIEKAKSGNLFLMKGKEGLRDLVTFIVPPERIKCFADVLMMTYFFTGSETSHWLDIWSMDYEHLGLKRLPLDAPDTHATFPHPETYGGDGAKYKELVSIYEGKKNDIGDKKRKGNQFGSMKWMAKAEKEAACIKKDTKGKRLNKKTDGATLQRNLRSFANQGNREDFMWTTIKRNQEWLQHVDFDEGALKHWDEEKKGRPQLSSFVANNMKATNDYKHKTRLAYLCNIKAYPEIKCFFQYHDKDLNEDYMALSMLIQWMFRSGLREKKHIDIYIPSQRVRNLLKDWLNGKPVEALK